jgi:hypothetical protein
LPLLLKAFVFLHELGERRFVLFMQDVAELLLVGCPGAAAAAKLRAKSFTLDGEAVVCGEDGVAIFDALHRHGTVRAAILQAFDLLEVNGEDLRPVMLGKRKLAVQVRPVAGLDQGQEPRQSGDGETSGGAMVALPDSADTAAWACGRGA